VRKSTCMQPVTTIGIDLGDRTSHACVVEGLSGRIVERFTVRSTRADFETCLGSRPRARVVVEAGTHSPWASRCLAEKGHEVIVANSRKVRLIAESDSKTDRLDAFTLARLGRVDVALLHPIRHRSAASQADLGVLRARAKVVAVRTSLINHVRGAAKSFGVRLPSSTAPAFVGRVREHVPPELSPALEPLLQTIDRLSRTIRRYNARIRRLGEERYPVTQRLRQVRGVGPLTALAYVLVLESPNRFRRTRRAAAYLGLCPRKAQSGGIDPQLHISKAGDGYVRQLLVGSAQYILGPFGPDCTLRRIGQRMTATGGRAAKKRAVVAVARRLAVLLLHLWRTGEDYEALRNAPPTPAPTAA
jgi:transposase